MNISRRILKFLVILITILLGIISVNNKISFLLFGLLVFVFIFIINKRVEIKIITLIIINENLLRIIPNVGNLTTIISILGSIIFIYKFKNIIYKKYTFKKYIIALVGICFASEIAAYYTFAQPIIQGLFGMNFIFIYIFYFYFVDLFNKCRDKNVRLNIIKMIAYTGTLLATLYLIQAIIYPKIVVFHMGFGSRSGRVRFFNGYTYIMFTIVVIYAEILKKYKINYLIFLFIDIISLIFVTQTRNYILGILFVILFGLFVSKKLTKTMVVCLLIIVSIIYFVLWGNSNNIFNNIISSIVYEFNMGQGNIGTRLLELDYYMKLLKENWLLGIGILYSKFHLTHIITGYDPYYYFVGDLGLFSVIIQTGIVGGIWMIMFFKKIYITGKKRVLNCNISPYITILMLALIIGVFGSGLIFDKSSILYISLVLALAEDEEIYNKNILNTSKENVNDICN